MLTSCRPGDAAKKWYIVVLGSVTVNGRQVALNQRSVGDDRDA